MRHPFNYLSLLSLPALAALIYFPTGDADFLGFLGFLVFLRYLWVNPDELFLLTLRRNQHIFQGIHPAPGGHQRLPG